MSIFAVYGCEGKVDINVLDVGVIGLGLTIGDEFPIGGAINAKVVLIIPSSCDQMDSVGSPGNRFDVEQRKAVGVR